MLLDIGISQVKCVSKILVGRARTSTTMVRIPQFLEGDPSFTLVRDTSCNISLFSEMQRAFVSIWAWHDMQRPGFSSSALPTPQLRNVFSPTIGTLTSLCFNPMIIKYRFIKLGFRLSFWSDLPETRRHYSIHLSKFRFQVFKSSTRKNVYKERHLPNHWSFVEAGLVEQESTRNK